jgi:hypothetical protein
MKISNYFLVGIMLFASSAMSDNVDTQQIGSWSLTWSTDSIFMTSANSGSNMLTGTLEIGNTMGVIDFCGEKFYIKSTGTLINDVMCHVKLDDGSKILVDYNFVIVPSATFWDKLSAGEVMTAPGNGMAYWYATMRMQTVNESLGWVNNNIFLLKGRELQGPTEGTGGIASYDIYKFSN